MSSTTGHIRGGSLPGPPMWEQMLDRSKLHVLTPPGIGDFAWVWSKTRHIPNVKYWFPGQEPRRVHTYCQLMGIDWGYGPPQFETDQMLLNFTGECGPEQLTPGAQVLHINRHLERGNPLMDWMPYLPYENPAPLWLATETKEDYIAVYMASERYSEGNLDPEEWGEILREIERDFLPVRLVGAVWDHEMAKGVTECYYKPKGPHCFCQPLHYALKVLTGGRAVIGLNGGVTILSTYMGTPTLEAYPEWLNELAGAWPTPDVKENRYWCNVRQLQQQWRPFLNTILTNSTSSSTNSTASPRVRCTPMTR